MRFRPMGSLTGSPSSPKPWIDSSSVIRGSSVAPGRFMIAKEKPAIAGFSYAFGKSFALIAGEFEKPPLVLLHQRRTRRGGCLGGSGAPRLTRGRQAGTANAGGTRGP